MQVTSTKLLGQQASPATQAKSADATTWQDALTQAQSQTLVPQAAAKVDSKSNEPKAKSAEAGNHVDAAPHEFAGTPAILLEHVKKPLVPENTSPDVAAPPRHGKDTPTPVAVTLLQPMVSALPAVVVATNTQASIKGQQENSSVVQNLPAISGVSEIVASKSDGIATTPDNAGNTASHTSSKATGHNASTVLAQALASVPQRDAEKLENVPQNTLQHVALLAAPDMNAASAIEDQSAVPSAKLGAVAEMPSESKQAPVSAGRGMNADARISQSSEREMQVQPLAIAAAKDEDGLKKRLPAVPPVMPTMPALHEAAMPIPAGGLPVSATAPVTQPSAAGLAAAVTAMHQAGHGGAMLRLDPPGLGDLAVHIATAPGGTINVLFVPTTQAGASALQTGLGGLGAALAQSGLTLGQAQVGGQFNQNAGQSGGYQPPRDFVLAPNATKADASTQSGLSAYA